MPNAVFRVLIYNVSWLVIANISPQKFSFTSPQTSQTCTLLWKKKLEWHTCYWHLMKDYAMKVNVNILPNIFWWVPQKKGIHTGWINMSVNYDIIFNVLHFLISNPFLILTKLLLLERFETQGSIYGIDTSDVTVFLWQKWYFYRNVWINI